MDVKRDGERLVWEYIDGIDWLWGSSVTEGRGGLTNSPTARLAFIQWVDQSPSRANRWRTFCKMYESPADDMDSLVIMAAAWCGWSSVIALSVGLGWDITVPPFESQSDPRSRQAEPVL